MEYSKKSKIIIFITLLIVTLLIIKSKMVESQIEDLNVNFTCKDSLINHECIIEIENLQNNQRFIDFQILLNNLSFDANEINDMNVYRGVRIDNNITDYSPVCNPYDNFDGNETIHYSNCTLIVSGSHIETSEDFELINPNIINSLNTSRQKGYGQFSFTKKGTPSSIRKYKLEFKTPIIQNEDESYGSSGKTAVLLNNKEYHPFFNVSFQQCVNITVDDANVNQYIRFQEPIEFYFNDSRLDPLCWGVRMVDAGCSLKGNEIAIDTWNYTNSCNILFMANRTAFINSTYSLYFNNNTGVNNPQGIYSTGLRYYNNQFCPTDLPSNYRTHEINTTNLTLSFCSGFTDNPSTGQTSSARHGIQRLMFSEDLTSTKGLDGFNYVGRLGTNNIFGNSRLRYQRVPNYNLFYKNFTINATYIGNNVIILNFTNSTGNNLTIGMMFKVYLGNYIDVLLTTNESNLQPFEFIISDGTAVNSQFPQHITNNTPNIITSTISEIVNYGAILNGTYSDNATILFAVDRRYYPNGLGFTAEQGGTYGRLENTSSQNLTVFSNNTFRLQFIKLGLGGNITAEAEKLYNRLSIWNTSSVKILYVNISLNISLPLGTYSNVINIPYKFNITTNDTASIDSCYYNVTFGSAINVEMTKTDCFNGTATGFFTVTSSGRVYRFYAFMNDTDGNTNVSSISFTIGNPGSGSGGGGGGGSGGGGTPDIIIKNISFNLIPKIVDRILIYTSFNGSTYTFRQELTGNKRILSCKSKNYQCGEINENKAYISIPYSSRQKFSEVLNDHVTIESVDGDILEKDANFRIYDITVGIPIGSFNFRLIYLLGIGLVGFFIYQAKKPAKVRLKLKKVLG